MSKLNCEVIIYNDSKHIQQVLTGYFLLEQQNVINLEKKIEKINTIDMTKDSHLMNAKKVHLKVIIDGGLTIYYDLHDSYEIDIDVMKDIDVYFKRSYYKPYIDSLKKSIQEKIFALGFYYPVYPNSIDFSSIKSFLRSSDFSFIKTYFPKIKDIEELPKLKTKKILFMTQTWDPYDNKNRAKEKIEERIEINETRANCIRALRKEFGNDFEGGFSNTEYTRKEYKDCIFQKTHLTEKRKYIEYLKQFPICVATAGLHGSIGAKFGEYIAMSKAIVTEQLDYEVVGDFQKNKNYLDFKTVDECIEQTFKIYIDDDLRFEMMCENAKYYQRYLRPNSLVLNSIIKAMEVKQKANN